VTRGRPSLFFKKAASFVFRRTFITGVTLAPAVALARAGDLASRCLSAIRAALAAMPAGPALLASYGVETGPARTDFDLTQANAAYVYDNALAGLALAAAGYRREAARIGDALAIAQAHDRFWADGRLRNAYQAGPMTMPAKLPGWWNAKAGRWQEDPYQAGSQSGPLAWAMLLWAELGDLAPANRAGDWLNRQLRAPQGCYGGYYGFEPDPLKLTWQSTEQNTDLFAAFTKLGRANDATHAGDFVRAMFDPAKSLFNAGIAPDGTPNPLLAADAGTWPYLAGIGSAKSAATAIARLRHGAGIGFSAASSSIWPEGTAFAALALQRLNTGEAADFLATVEAQISPSGFVYAAVSGSLATGLDVEPPLPGQSPQPFNYFRRPALAPTAWAALSALGVNPLST
jgi:hypothetical protein